MLRKKKHDPDTVVCWDAPLTGPTNPDRAIHKPREFSQRCIESFFSRGKFKAPKGISVLPYSGCPHWAITRSLLGLPRTGQYDARYEDLPFHLLPGDDRTADARPAVVEIHPAVAAWLWCRGRDGFPKDCEPWPYKKDQALRKRMWGVIREKTRGVACPCPPNHGDDDDFDAWVGYLLGVLYLRDLREPSPSVILLGNRATGSFLVPTVDGLSERWEQFVREWPNVRSR